MNLGVWASLLFCWTTLSYATETNHLRYYETLSDVHVSSHVKRSSHRDAELVKKVQFHTFQRNFHLTLKSGSPVLTKNFRARLIHKDGTSTTFPVDQSKIFTGHDTSNPESVVHAHLEDSLWSIHVIEENETYAIEPAWRILSAAENPRNDTLVAYRMSDLKGIAQRSKFCAASEDRHSSGAALNPVTYKNTSQDRSHPHVLTFVPWGGLKDKKKGRRKERSTVRNTCQLYLVGDADFFNKRCQRNHFSCSSLMIEYLQFADYLYRTSPFEDRLGRRFYGIGLQIGELILLTDYSGPSLVSPVRHFNEKFTTWDAGAKLTAFTTHMRLTKEKYCLNHLFTEFADPEGVLGLAYVDQLCRWRDLRMPRESYNSGITSGSNSKGFLLPSLTTSLVFSHEIGHNFGANHDPDTPECAPSDHRGGKFLMWEYSVSGYRRNNRKFSNCSLRTIGRNIPAHCFQERSQLNHFCGNGIVDRGEECDAGFFGIKDDNKCCSRNCTLRPGAVCSEVNHECCVNCQVAPATTLCRDTRKTFSCLKTSYCLGTANVCLDGGFKKDGVDCGEMHKCYGGVCTSPCELEAIRLKTVRLKSCMCHKNATEACLWCCFDVTDPRNPGECKPILPHPRNDGTSCFFGTCRDGNCAADIRDQYNTRLSAYIRFVQKSSLEQFLRTNIVLIVVVLSLVLWVPSSLWIHAKDVEQQDLRDMLTEAMLERAALTHTDKDREGKEEEDDDDDEEEEDFDPPGLQRRLTGEESSSSKHNSELASTSSAEYLRQMTHAALVSMRLKGSSYAGSQRSEISAKSGQPIPPQAVLYKMTKPARDDSAMS